MKRSIAVLAMASVLAAAPVSVSAQPAPDAGLNMQSADIRAFIQDAARQTGRTFIVDPRVQGNVTIASDGALQPGELFDVLMSTLRANGLIAVPAGANTYRIVPDESAAQQPAAVVGYATEIYRLNSIEAAAAAEVLTPLVGPQGVIAATAQGNALVIADYADNLRRIRALIAQIDQDRAAIETVTLRNSSAREIIGAVNQLIATPGQQGPARSTRITLAPVESSNSIVLRGEPALVRQVIAMITDLDQRAASSDDVRVVRLQHASAEKLLPVLQQIVGQAPTSLARSDADPRSGPQAPAVAEAAAPTPATAQPNGRRANISWFEGANALVISADPETQRMLGDVVRQLDTRREQVLVEAIVVEVSDDAAKQLGVQFLLSGDQTSGAPFFATNYTNSAPNLLAITGAIAGGNLLPGSDTAAALRDAAIASLLGTNGAVSGGAGQSNGLIFGAIINAVKSDAASDLLSTPSVMTLDNESARLLVGQEVPITTGEVLGAANVNPFRTVQRQNVGIQLEVKPQINADGAITLLLRQEVSAVAGPVSASFSELILNKREISTTVLVDDGDIVVLGGLLDQNERLLVDKVPGLGDLPGIGALFRSTSVERNKRNLMVFIRPTIVRNPADAQNIAAPRYDYIRSQEMTRRAGRSALEDAVRDYLRANPPTPQPAEPRP